MIVYVLEAYTNDYDCSWSNVLKAYSDQEVATSKMKLLEEALELHAESLKKVEDEHMQNGRKLQVKYAKILNDGGRKNPDYSAYMEELRAAGAVHAENLKRISEEFICFAGEEYRKHFMDNVGYFTNSDCNITMYPLELD